MKRLYIICILIFLTLTGCVGLDRTVCRHTAINAAILHKSENPKDEVLLCLGKVEGAKDWHVQAKYRKPGGKWVFLKPPPRFTNFNSEQEDFEIVETVSIERWLRECLEVIE